MDTFQILLVIEVGVIALASIFGVFPRR